MRPDMSAARAPAGDVTAAILDVDSALKRSTEPAAARRGAGLLDGFCTLLYLFITADVATACRLRAKP